MRKRGNADDPCRADRIGITRRKLIQQAALLGASPLLPPSVARAGDGASRVDPAWSGGTATTFQARIDRLLRDAVAAADEAAATIGRPTVAVTLKPYDRARNALVIASNQAQLLASAGTTPQVRAAARRAVDAVAVAAVGLDLDPRVHAALAALEKTADLRRADPATRRYVAQALLRGRLAGADRDAATRAEVGRIQARIAAVTARYMATMQRSAPTITTTSAALDGLPADYLARNTADARGTVTLTATTIDALPVLRFAHDPGIRQRMYREMQNLAYPANVAPLVELLAARAALARTMGYASYADLTMADQMLTTANAADALLDRIDALSAPIAAREAAEIERFARSVDPAATVTAADAGYWSERYRRERFGSDGQELRAYLPFAAVQAGVMDFAARFFGVRFVPAAHGAAWHAAVAVFDVHDRADAGGGDPIGRIYIDAHPRPGKDHVFATAPLVPGIRGRQLPEGVILCNLPGGGGDPGLLAHSDVVNLVHEFGHLMHHVLAGQGCWAGQGAFDTEEDFLEAPSQMLEEFTRDATILQAFARHHRTGAALPMAVIEQLNRAAAFGRTSWIRSQLQRARFALAVHRGSHDAASIAELNAATLRAASPHAPLADVHEYAASPHLIGYGPNYYAYLLDKMIAVDVAARFPLRDPAAGPAAARYRQLVLEPGATRSASNMLRDFLDRDPDLHTLSMWMTGGASRP